MEISVNFLPIRRFPLDKKIPRAIVSEPIVVFLEFAESETYGVLQG